MEEYSKTELLEKLVDYSKIAYNLEEQREKRSYNTGRLLLIVYIICFFFFILASKIYTESIFNVLVLTGMKISWVMGIIGTIVVLLPMDRVFPITPNKQKEYWSEHFASLSKKDNCLAYIIDTYDQLLKSLQGISSHKLSLIRDSLVCLVIYLGLLVISWVI